MNTKSAFVKTGIVAIGFVLLNVCSIQFRSSGGLLAALGIVRCYDCIRAWGFPLEVWRSGGYIGERVFRFDALVVDVVVALIVSVAAGLVWARRR